MIKKISIKTRLGWISAFENKGKIFKIKFGKIHTQSKSRVLKNLSVCTNRNLCIFQMQFWTKKKGLLCERSLLREKYR